MFGAVMAEIRTAPAAGQNAIEVKQAGAVDLTVAAQRADPYGVTLLASRARQTDIATAATTAALPPDAAR
jgi:hypothetical protein